MSDKETIRANYLKTKNKLKKFLLATGSKQFLIFLFFVFISFSFWLIQVLNDQFETDIKIALTLKDIPENTIITRELPDQITVRVRDKGIVLVNYTIGSYIDGSLSPVKLKFSENRLHEGTVIFNSSRIEELVKERLSPTTQLIKLRPDTLRYTYTREKGRRVPVIHRGSLIASDKHYVSSCTLTPDSVCVYAPLRQLDTITAAYTIPTDIIQQNDSVTHKTLSLASLPGAKFVPEHTDAAMHVDILSEKTLEIPIQTINVPSGRRLKTFPQAVKITFNVGLSKYKDITPENFFICADYNTLSSNKPKCRLKLMSFPPEISNPRFSPAEADYLIEEDTHK